MKTMVEIEREVDTAGVRVSATLDFTERVVRWWTKGSPKYFVQVAESRGIRCAAHRKPEENKYLKEERGKDLNTNLQFNIIQYCG